MRHRVQDRDPLHDLGEIAWDVLARMVRELLARRPGGHLIEARLDELELSLRLPLRGPGADPASFSEELRAALEQMLDDAIEHAATFRPGHAWCHRCGVAACEHARVPSARHVFVGYGPTGLPRWEDFAQHCLDVKHPDVDRLYRVPPALLTVVHDARTLRGGLLDAFEGARVRLLGQVVAGFYRVPAREEEGRGVVAVSFQAMGTRSRGGGLRLGLNVLGRSPGGGDLDMLWERQAELPWRRAVRWAQAALATVEGQVRRRGRRPVPTGGEELEERVGAILRGLARRMERDSRARGRRTSHAELRHESGDRPTRQAVEDARVAAPDAVLADDRTGALVILGDRGRTHFFSLEGRLISSVRYSREAIERKRAQGLWRPAPQAAAAALLQHLAGEPPV